MASVDSFASYGLGLGLGPPGQGSSYLSDMSLIDQMNANAIARMPSTGTGPRELSVEGEGGGSRAASGVGAARSRLTSDAMSEFIYSISSYNTGNSA